VFFDDYVGNQINVIVGEYLLHEVMEQMSFIENAAYVSYSYTIRRHIWANSDETLFSPTWRKGVDTHFGMTGHVAAAWTLAYSMLRATLEYCEDASWDYPTASSAMLVPQLVQREETPPLLDAKLSTYASQLTQLAKAVDEKKESHCQSNARFERPCAFAFIAGEMGTVKNGNQISDYLQPFTVGAAGWRGKDDTSTGYHNKFGLEPVKGIGSSSVLRVDVQKADIRFFRVHWMKSYGAKWDGSKARFHVRILHNGTTHYETQWELEGFHNQNISIQYPFLRDLGKNKATVGSQILFNMTFMVSYIRIHMRRFRQRSCRLFCSLKSCCWCFVGGSQL
jgi:hypothetical protein